MRKQLPQTENTVVLQNDGREHKLQLPRIPGTFTSAATIAEAIGRVVAAFAITEDVSRVRLVAGICGSGLQLQEQSEATLAAAGVTDEQTLYCIVD